MLNLMKRVIHNLDSYLNPWSYAEASVLLLPPHQEIIIPKYAVPHPKSAGYVRSIGLRKGQKRDYRKRVGQKGLHIREYDHYYKLHWDKYYPHSPAGFVRHEWYDDPLGYLKLIAMGTIPIGLAGYGGYRLGRKLLEKRIANSLERLK